MQKHKNLTYFKGKTITLIIWSGYFSARSSILVPPFAQAIITCRFMIHHRVANRFSSQLHCYTCPSCPSSTYLPPIILLRRNCIPHLQTCKAMPIPVKKDEALTGPALARSKAIAKYISLIRASFSHKKTCTQTSFDQQSQRFPCLCTSFLKKKNCSRSCNDLILTANVTSSSLSKSSYAHGKDKLTYMRFYMLLDAHSKLPLQITSKTETSSMTIPC